MDHSGGQSSNVSEQASLSGRYASALFGLARDGQQINAVSTSLESLSRALAESPDLARLVSSPLVQRGDAAKAMAALASTLQIDPLTANFLGVLATNGRLHELARIIASIRALAAAHRGEITAEVTTAHPLDDRQVEALKTQLKTQLKARAGRDVTIDAKVDPAILGGIVVRLGSQMIDASIRTKLNTLATAMKG